MALITDYTTLQTAVTDYLARSDLSTWLPNFVQNWEERFYRNPYNWGRWMEDSLSVAISSGVAAVPADFLGLRAAYLDGISAPPLQWVSLQQLLTRFPRTISGQPKWISRDAENFVFGPVAQSGTLVGTYYAKPETLRAADSGGTSDEHWLVLNAPDLLLYGALMEAEAFLKNDQRIPLWKAAYDEALSAYRKFQCEQSYSSSGLSVTVA